MKSRRSSRSASSRRLRSAPSAFGSAALAAGALLSPLSAFAATQTLAVSGNWDTTSPVWNGGVTWTNGNDAVFAGSASAIEIAGAITVSGISSANTVAFNNNVPGGTITFVSPATLSGGGALSFNLSVAGSAGLTVNNPGGTVSLNAENTLSGPVAVQAGSLALGANGALNAINALSISSGASLSTGGINQIGQVAVTNAGALSLGGNDNVQSYVSNGGVLNGPGTLTAAAGYVLNNGSTVNGNLGNGVITTNGAVALNGNTSASGSLAVQSGVATVNANLGATTVSVSNGATLATGASGNLANTAAVNLNASGALQLGASDTIGNLTGAGTVNLDGNTLTLSNGAGATSAAAINGAGGVTLSAGTQTLSGASAYTGATNVNGGTLALTGSLASTQVNVASGAALTSAGGLADATQLTLGITGTATFTGAETLAGLSAGTGAINASGVDLTVANTLDAAGNITVRNLDVGTLNGSAAIASTGVVSAESGAFSGNISSGSLLKDGAGTLTLSASQSFMGGATVSAGTLVLGHATNTLADSGALVLSAGATLDLQGNTDTVGSFTANGGTVSGTGTLTAATYALNNGAVIDANLGAGALTANGNVAINGGVAAANFTVQSGATTLAGSAAATSVSVAGGSLDLSASGSVNSANTLGVSAGASLSTAAANQLSDTAAVTNAGSLTLNGNDTVASLSNSGSIAGPGVLTTADGVYTLNAGSTVSGNLGAGTLNIQGNTGVSGTSAASAVNVNAGQLSLTGNNLSDSAAVTNSATLLVAGDDTVGSLVNTGALSGAGTLTAATYDLRAGSSVSGNLGLGVVTVSGSTTVTGTLAALAVNVNNGVTLSLDGDNLADSATLTLGTGGVINLAANETVGTFVNNAGSLAGFGTLTAADYILNDGTVVSANLGNGNVTTNGTVLIEGVTGTGAFTVATGSTTLATFTGANSLNVNAGASLLLTADAELNIATAVDIGAGATLSTGGINQIGNAVVTNAGTLVLGGNDTVSHYVSNGGTVSGAALVATTYALNHGSTVNSNLGAGDLTANGTVAINGSTGAGTFTVQSGETTLNNAASAGLVTVSGGTLSLTGAGALNAATAIDIASGATLSLGASNQLADAAAVTNAGTLALGANDDTVGTYAGAGALTGTGTLTAATYALADGAVIDANLGAGALTTTGTVTINGDTAASSLTVQSGVITLAGDSAATTVQVDAGASLATTATGTLADTAAVTLTGTGALTLGQNETIANLNGAGTVALGNTTLTLANGAGATSAAVISGTGGLTLVSGAQTLTGASAYTGDTTVQGGTLTLDGNNASERLLVQGGALQLNATSAAASVDIDAGATLATGAAERLNNNVLINNDGALTLGGNETLGAFTGTGVVNLGGFNLNFAGDGDAVSGELTSDFAGAINGSGTITKSGSDIQVLSGVSGYSGIARVAEGILRVTNAGALGATGANGRTNVLNGGTLEIANSISLAESIRVTGSGVAAAFTGNDSYLTSLGALHNLSGDNTLTGQIGIVGGQPDVVIGASSGTLRINADVVRSVFEVGDVAASVPRLTFQAAAGTTITVVGTNANIFGPFAGVVDIAKTGGGTLDLSGLVINNSSGDLYLTDGTVRIALESRLGGSAVIFGATDRGTLRVANTATQTAISAGAGQVLSGGDGDFANFRNTVFNFAAGDGTFFTETDAAIRLSNLQNFGSSQLVKAGSADLLLDLVGGGDAKILPSLVINSGRVFFLAEDTAALTFAGLSGAGGDLDLGALDATFNQTVSSTFGGNLSGTGDLTINALTGAQLVASGVFAGFNSVTIGGDSTGRVELSGASTYLGSTNVATGGNLLLTGTLQTAAVDIATGATLALGASDRLGNPAVTVTNAGTFDLGAFNETIAAFTSNGGTLSGTGTLTAATYALNNNSVINANLGTGAATANGTVAINGDIAAESLTVQTGTTTLAGDSAATTVQVDTGASLVTTATGTLADTAAVTLSGTGALTLGQNETIGSLVADTGVINAAGVDLTVTGLLDADGTLAVRNLSAGTLAGDVDVTSTGNVTATTLNGTAAASLSSPGLITASNGAYAGAILSGALTKISAGTLALSGANTYAGATNVNGGTLALTGSLVSTEVNVASGATLTSTGGLADGTDLTLNGTAAATFTGAETLDTLNGAGSVAATNLTVTTINSSATIASSGVVTISDGAFSGSQTSGGLTKVSAGTLTLSGSSTTAGPVTINGGTLVLANAANTLANNAAVVANAGTTLDIQGNTDTVGSLQVNAANVVGTGTLTAATYDLNDGAVIRANLGDGVATVEGQVRVLSTLGAGNLDLTVLNGGTLRGLAGDANRSFTIDGDLTVATGGTLAPGASPGFTVVTGDWTQNGVFATELAGTGGAGVANGHDQIQVGGDITLGGSSTLAIQRDGALGFVEPARGNTFRIIVGDLTNQKFATVTTQFSTGLVLDLADGTLIGTGLPAAPGSTSGLTNLATIPGLDANTIALVNAFQQQAFAGDPNGVQLNSSVANGTPAGAALRALLTTPIGAQNGIQRVSPENFAGESAYAVRATRHYADTALHAPTLARAGDWSLFAAWAGHSASTDSSPAAGDYDLEGSGTVAGARLPFGESTVLGVYAAFDSGDVSGLHRTGDVTGQVFGLLAETAVGEKNTLTASVATGNYESDSSRASLYGGRARANGIDIDALHLSVGLSHAIVAEEDRGFSPYVEFRYTDSSSSAFREAAPAFDALAVQAIDYTSLEGELGARGFIMVTDKFGFNAQVGVTQEFGDDNVAVRARLANGGAPFQVRSPGFGDTALGAGLGSTYDFTPAFRVGAGVKAAIVSDADTAVTYHVGGSFRF